MKRATLFACLVMAVAAYHVVGAEPEKRAEPQKASPEKTPPSSPQLDETPAAGPQVAEVTEPVIPEPEIAFEDKEEPFEIKVDAAVPEALQQQFAAKVQFGAGLAVKPPRWGFSETTDRLRRSLLRPSRAHAPLFHFLAQIAPHDRLPPPDLVEALTAPDAVHVRDYRQYVRPVPNEGEREGSTFELRISFVIVAPTRERAKELTRAAITLFHYGYSYPMQREFLIRKGQGLEELAMSRANLSEIEAEMAGYEKQLEAFADYEDVSEEALNGLITEQRLISVDLAGVRARIAACTKILADRDQLRPSQIEQVEQIKITAEIELVGLEARKAAIDLIVGKAAERRKLSEKLADARARAEAAEKRIDSAQIRIDELESMRAQYGALAIEGGVIPIHPIKWISTEGGERPSQP